jgi:hypothetical protein
MGLLHTSQEDKQEAFFNHFEGLLGTAMARSSTLDLDFFHREGLDLSALDQPITEEEVWNTICSEHGLICHLFGV